MRELMTQAQIDADPEQWIEHRRNLITATDMAGILGADEAFSSPLKVYLEKTAGLEHADSVRFIMARHDEAKLADFYEGLHEPVVPGYMTRANWLVNAGLCVSDDYPWLGATFDRIEEPDGIVVELKTWWSDDGWGAPPHGDIPLQYHVQCLIQGFVRGAKMVKLFVYFRGSDKIACYWIPLDDNAQEDIAFFISRAERFRNDYLLPRVMPPADGHKGTTMALKSAFVLAETNRVVVPKKLWTDALKAKQRLDAATLAYDQARNRIAEEMGNAELAVTRNGDRVMTRSLSWPRRIDTKRLRADYPEIAEEVTKHPDEDHPEIKFLLKQPTDRT